MSSGERRASGWVRAPLGLDAALFFPQSPSSASSAAADGRPHYSISWGGTDTMQLQHTSHMHCEHTVILLVVWGSSSSSRGTSMMCVAVVARWCEVSSHVRELAHDGGGREG